MNGRELIKLLEQNGWQLVRIKGSHHVMKKEGIERQVSVPVHKGKDIPKGTCKQILKKAGLK